MQKDFTWKRLRPTVMLYLIKVKSSKFNKGERWNKGVSKHEVLVIIEPKWSVETSHTIIFWVYIINNLFGMKIFNAD